MRILFVFYKPIIPNNGGVQRITFSLSEFFKTKGITSKYLCPMYINDNDELLSDQLLLPDDTLCTDQNKKKLASIIRDYQIDVIINQMSYFKNALDLLDGVANTNIKILTVCHISPSSDWNYFYDSHYMQFKKLHLDKFESFLRSKYINESFKFILKFKYKRLYKNAISKSDRFILLSDTYKKELMQIIGSGLIDKVESINNPTPFEATKTTTLENKVLYVGRISINQKRIDLLINIWNKIVADFPEWTLTIVGTGPDVDYVKKIASTNNIKNVSFEGKQDPKKFYSCSSILALTSTYEGFPMSIVEGLQFGLVPIAFNSYSALSDVIVNYYNGIMVKSFDVEEYARSLSALMKNPSVLKQMSENSILLSKKFSMKNIGLQWLNLLGKFGR